MLEKLKRAWKTREREATGKGLGHQSSAKAGKITERTLILTTQDETVNELQIFRFRM